jgi:hypothetical protein
MLPNREIAKRKPTYKAYSFWWLELGREPCSDCGHTYVYETALEVSRVVQDSALLCLVYFLFDGSASILVGGAKRAQRAHPVACGIAVDR